MVLVHGAYADGSSWSDVIPLLQRAGLTVTAVQNPLTFLADDVAATNRALDRQDGPTVLAGHSWAGTIISEAGNHPRVTALVYVAARAPDAGEDYNALAAKYPTPPANAGLVHHDGYAQLSESAFLADFAGGIEETRAPAPCTRCRARSPRTSSRAARRRPPGGTGSAITRSPRRTARQRRSWSGFWPIG